MTDFCEETNLQEIKPRISCFISVLFEQAIVLLYYLVKLKGKLSCAQKVFDLFHQQGVSVRRTDFCFIAPSMLNEL